MKIYSVKRKVQAFWASCNPPCQSEISPFFWNGVHEWQHLETSKLIYHRHSNNFPVVISKFFEKNEILLAKNSTFFASSQWTTKAFTNSVIVLFICMLSFLFVITCSLFNRRISVQVIKIAYPYLYFLPRSNYYEWRGSGSH